MSSILLDTLKEGLDSGLAEMLEKDSALKNDTQQYLEELLVNAELLSTEMFTTSSGQSEGKNKNLVEEIAELDHQSRQIELQLASIANDNRDLIVGVSEDVRHVHKTIGEELDRNIEAMKQSFGSGKIAVDNKAVKKVSHSISANNSLLRNMDSILDIYELPTLCGLCIMQGNYQEALEISTSVKMLTVKFPNSKTFKKLQSQIDNELKLMVRGLIKLLNTNLKQSNILKIFQILNRPNLVATHDDSLDESDQDISGNKTLKLIYLNSRFKFIMNEVASLKPLLKLKKLTYLKRYIEIYREHLYNSLSIYHAIFLSSGLNSDANDDKLLLHMYIKKLVYLMVEELRAYLPVISEGDNDADTVEANSLRDGVILQVIYLCRSLSKYGLDFESLITTG
ncbi:hypothetical protein CXQ85_003573 [Candidozyma haemuli]|uniref:Conserved oligomeric Golgi complex subunit 8 n=1 Tax=Candidozyma haemuli TaxID=45357 RepID=A0A2V1APE6_9ASCO|nr:hypothetical protein CXQ85_003573 [[Candida] haemuloni]PVH19718.1 hypothetical protein CXQ85_003573 [[Candida] haemuloni]